MDVPVETTDLAPALAAMIGAEMASDGQSLLPLLRDEAGDAERPAYTESYYQHVLLGWSPLRAVRTSRWKLIEAPRRELYDLQRDPGELQNAIAARAALDLGRIDEARPDYQRFIHVAPREYRQQVAAARDVLRRLDAQQR